MEPEIKSESETVTAANQAGTQTFSTERLLVESFYDLQKLRCETFNRIVCHLKEKYTKEQLAELIKQYEGVDTEVEPELQEATAPKENEGEEEKLPPQYAVYAKMLAGGKVQNQVLQPLVEYYNQLFSTEKKTMVRLDELTAEVRIRKEYLSGIRGIGPTLSAGIIGWIYPISRFETISKLWRYSGLAVIDGHAERKKKKEKIHYNPKLKTFMWKVSKSFVYQSAEKSPYRKLYDEAKADYKRKHPEVETYLNEKGEEKKRYNPGHLHNMALRKVAKVFLANLWVKWRSMEGLSVSEPYVFGVLGHDKAHKIGV